MLSLRCTANTDITQYSVCFCFGRHNGKIWRDISSLIFLRKEIIPLTSLRGVAALSVIAMHFSATLQQIASRPFPSLVPHATLAVDVFFVLSGFIMGYSHLKSFQFQKMWVAYKSFIGKRAARILPLNAFVVIVVVTIAALSSWLLGVNMVPTVNTNSLLQDLLTNLLLLPGIGIGNSVNWPAWSISVEFAVYFIFPLLLFGVFHANRAVFVVVCIAALIVLAKTAGFSATIDGIHNHSWPWRDITRCLTEFILGLAAFRVYASKRAAHIFARDSATFLISATIIAVVLMNLPGILAVVLFPALILALATNSGWVAWLMSLPIPYFLGQISFSLYLVTDPFRFPLQQTVHWFHPTPLSPMLAMPLAAIFSLLMIVPAWTCYKLVEMPGRSAARQATAEHAKIVTPEPSP